MIELARQFSPQIETLLYLIMLINGILHLVFAGAVAQDAGNLIKMGHKPILVSASTWAFATLTGGIFVAAIYWIFHHSTLTRLTTRDRSYDKHFN